MKNQGKRTLGSFFSFIFLLGLVTAGGFTAGVVTGLVLVTEHGPLIQQKLGKFIDFKTDGSEDGATPIAIPDRAG